MMDDLLKAILDYKWDADKLIVTFDLHAPKQKLWLEFYNLMGKIRKEEKYLEKVKYLKEKQISERNLEIYNDRKSGKTYREIGKKFNLSADRIRQIYIRVDRIKSKKYGLINRP